MLSKIWNAVKSGASKAYSFSPFAIGIVIGYVFKPEIKLVVDGAVSLVKGILKL
jgi:hypothetical protein